MVNLLIANSVMQFMMKIAEENSCLWIKLFASLKFQNTSQEKTYVWWWMLTRFIMVINSQYTQILKH